MREWKGMRHALYRGRSALAPTGPNSLAPAEAVEDLLADLAPNRITDYLYELSGKCLLGGSAGWQKGEPHAVRLPPAAVLDHCPPGAPQLHA